MVSSSRRCAQNGFPHDPLDNTASVRDNGEMTRRRLIRGSVADRHAQQVLARHAKDLHRVAKVRKRECPTERIRDGADSVLVGRISLLVLSLAPIALRPAKAARSLHSYGGALRVQGRQVLTLSLTSRTYDRIAKMAGQSTQRVINAPSIVRIAHTLVVPRAAGG